jgi:trk system potassium uptake protein TrkA
LIHRPDYADLVEKIGIDRAISPRVVMAHEMLAWLRKGKASTLASLDNSEAEILELVVEGEDFVGHTLRDLGVPTGSLVIALLRDKEVFLPSANTIFQLGDIVLVITRNEVRKKVIRLIAGDI